jgi:uncharacterized protein
MTTYSPRMAHPILHFQMILKDPDKSSRFYTDLFGWTVEAPDAMGFRMLSTNAPDGIGGGIWPEPPGGTGFVQLFGTDDVAASVEAAKKLGATVEVPPTKLPKGGGWQCCMIRWGCRSGYGSGVRSGLSHSRDGKDQDRVRLKRFHAASRMAMATSGVAQGDGSSGWCQLWMV